MKRIDDYRVLIALKDVAKNLVALANANVPTYPKLECSAYFGTAPNGEQYAGIVVEGIKREQLPELVSQCNSREFYNLTRFGRGITHYMPIEHLLPYVETK